MTVASAGKIWMDSNQGASRVATSMIDTEWATERDSRGNYDRAGAFASSLKLIPAGCRDDGNDTLFSAGFTGDYWSSTVNGSCSRYLFFSSGRIAMTNSYRVNSMGARCIKD